MHKQYGDTNCVSLSNLLSTILNGTSIYNPFFSFHLRNAPDFASRASSPSAALLPQLLSVPLGFSLVSFLGIIVSSSSQVIYNEAIWSPIDLLNKFLDGDGNHPSRSTRFGVWFISTSFILAQACDFFDILLSHDAYLINGLVLRFHSVGVNSNFLSFNYNDLAYH